MSEGPTFEQALTLDTLEQLILERQLSDELAEGLRIMSENSGLKSFKAESALAKWERSRNG